MLRIFCYRRPWILTAAVVVHSLGYLLVAGVVALLVYEKLGLTILRTAWFNIDFAWPWL